ncbi:hypothetical protein C7B61_08655, partial [filamentous cyanobacterium CCP1]
MKRNQLEGFALARHSSVLLSVLLLMGGTAEAKPDGLRPAGGDRPVAETVQANEMRLAQVTPDAPLTAAEQAELERLRQLNQTTTLFNVMLVVLSLLLIAAMTGLYLLRRSVIREVTLIVESHLKELGDLESQITHAKAEVRKLLQEYEDYAADLGEDAETFQKEIESKRENVAQLITDISQRKQE